MRQTELARPRDRLRGIMAGLEAQIADALPKHLDAKTMTRVVLVEGVRNPDLRLCSPESLAGSIMLASQLGLLCSSPLGQFYLVPRRVKLDWRDKSSAKTWQCGFVIGYKGYAELARRAGLRLNAGCVYTSELDGGFEWTNEPPSLTHRGTPSVDRADENLQLAYAVAVDERRGRAGHRWQLVMDRATVDEARALAQTDKIWAKHFAAMARKTAIRRLLNNGLVPLSSDLEHALAREREQEIERAEVIESADIKPPPPMALADPLRAALDLNVEEDEIPAAELAELAQELEGHLESGAIVEAVEAAGLDVDPDVDLSTVEVATLRKYVKELQARR